MAVEVKFCGLTRRDDAAEAARLGAGYAGVIFAGGPRKLDPERAGAVLDGAPGTARAGVFGADAPESIGEVARALALDVVQLHGDPDADTVEAVRGAAGARVWAVLRVRGDALPPRADALFAAADAVVLDAMVDGALGGTGVALGWEAIADAVQRARRAGSARLVLAGGLRPENVGRAISILAPDVVDVSSGVEATVGIKDHARMRAFAEAVRNGAGR